MPSSITPDKATRPLALARYGVLLMLASLAAVAQAQEPPARTIGLVLGGGGARGSAHVGVLQKMEELRIPVHCVAGTSMGGLIAGAFSTGMSPKAMQTSLKEANWRDMLSDAASLADFTPRMKGLSRNYIPGSEAGIKNGELQFPSGVLTGQKIKFLIDRVIRADHEPQRIENQPLPLALLTTDIVTGERRVWRSGDLSSLILATMSVPGLIAPVKYEGYTLVDGGLVDNVPVDEVMKLCKPDVIIAVNVGSPLLKAEEIELSPLSVTAQMVNLLTEQNVTKSLGLLRPGVDIYIRPELTGFSAADFERTEEGIARGYAAATAAQQALQALSASPQQYAAWQQRMARSDTKPATLARVEVGGVPERDAALFASKIRARAGTQLDAKMLEEDLLLAYGEGRYSNLSYQLFKSEDKNVLRLFPTEKPWGPNFVRSGVNFAWGTRDEAKYNIRVAYQMTQLNSNGAELLLTGQLGSENLLAVNLYQPLDESRLWFAEANARISTQSVDLYQSGESLARFKSTSDEVNLGLGLNLNRHGTLKLGVLSRNQSASMLIGPSSVLPGDGSTSSSSAWFALIDLDRFNRAYFPTSGWQAKLTQTQFSDYTKLDGNYSQAVGFGSYVLTGRLAFTQASEGVLPISDAATLGGVNNLSGLAHRQLIGSDMRYGGLRAEKIVSQMPLGIRGDLRVGISMEVGSMRQRYSESQGTDPVRSASLYLGGELPLGPLYLGVAKATGNTARIYIFIGNP
jgi:NTE family protein